MPHKPPELESYAESLCLSPNWALATMNAKESMSSSNPNFTAADLVPGQAYSVITEFIDYDGIIHPVGERWRFVEKNFLPYEDGLTLVVERNGPTVPFRLQWRAEAQGQIIDHFSDFVEEV